MRMGEIERAAVGLDARIRQGRFQRGLALIAGLSSIVAGLEVTVEHYRGSYSRRIMYTPVALGGALVAAGLAAVRSPRAGRTVLPVTSALTLADGLAGFDFHVRGVHASRAAGAPVMNIIMGPPVFAPLLFGISGYLGLVAAGMLRRGTRQAVAAASRSPGLAGRRGSGRPDGDRLGTGPSRGALPERMAAAAIVAAGFSGVEAWSCRTTRTTTATWSNGRQSS